MYIVFNLLDMKTSLAERKNKLNTKQMEGKTMKKDNTSKITLYHDFIKWIDQDNCKKKEVLNWGNPAHD